MEKRRMIISEQAKVVSIRKKEAFKIKEEAAKALEKFEADLSQVEHELQQGEDNLKTLVNGTTDYAKEETRVSDLRMKVEEVRGKRNTALALFQSKEKFAVELEVHEATQSKLRDNLLMWITALRSDTEERVVTFKSRLEAMKAMSDQDIAKQLDDIGAETDQRNVDYMAQAGSASDRIRTERLKEQPKRIRETVEALAAQIERTIQDDEEMRGLVEQFKRRYGIDPLSTFPHEKFVREKEIVGSTRSPDLF